MESEIEKLHQSLNFTDEEEGGVIAPLGVWNSESDEQGFLMVGRILAHRPYHPEALRTALLSSFNPVKGMEFKLIDGDRFLLKFYHVLDRDRVVERSPWALDKNLVTVRSVNENENPATVNLDWSEFFIHIYNLPIENGAINITKPIPRVLKIKSIVGDELIVSFKYERLPNFCYLCGCLGHLSRICPRRFDEGFVDPGDNTPYGPWLRTTITSACPKYTSNKNPSPSLWKNQHSPTQNTAHQKTRGPTKSNRRDSALSDIAALPTAMNLIAWNCQGLGAPWTVHGLGDLLRQHRPSLVFLSETKCSLRHIEALKKKFDVFGIGVEARGRSG
ncbi:UNVERIFIED_CONTAM: hypothetical protein Slati_0417000 [Sesamum latifolium]|uniref:CCHC-type domain-containing protein n=1 Tax=Sesamum latifolium TaxID=2727402 RepID=A0AAW2XW75_9LAMI